jgi:hypothetical protein
MNDFLDSFSNREISIATWFVVIFGGMIILSKSFKSFGLVIKAFFAKQLIPHYLVIIGYFTLILYLLKQTILWEESLWKDFIIWCVAFGFYSFFITNKIHTNKDLFKQFWRIFSLTIFVDFFLNYFTFSLVWEIILIPVLSFIAILQFFTEYHMQKKSDYSRVNNFLKSILSISGFALFFYCIYRLTFSYKDFLSNDSLKNFLLQVILSVIYFPIIAFYSSYHKYESIFKEVDRYQFIDKKRKRNIKLATIIYGNLNLDKLTRIRRWDKKEIQSIEDIFGYIKNL